MTGRSRRARSRSLALPHSDRSGTGADGGGGWGDGGGTAVDVRVQQARAAGPGLAGQPGGARAGPPARRVGGRAAGGVGGVRGVHDVRGDGGRRGGAPLPRPRQPAGPPAQQAAPTVLSPRGPDQPAGPPGLFLLVRDASAVSLCSLLLLPLACWARTPSHAFAPSPSPPPHRFPRRSLPKGPNSKGRGLSFSNTFLRPPPRPLHHRVLLPPGIIPNGQCDGDGRTRGGRSLWRPGSAIR
jgi:hypothetical protein